MSPRFALYFFGGVFVAGLAALLAVTAIPEQHLRVLESIPVFAMIALAAGRPEFIRLAPDPNGIPGVEIRFGGFDANSVAMLGMALTFVLALVAAYLYYGE